MSDVKSWYNEYAGKQQSVGVNARHRSIMRLLKKHGLKKEHTVLEIGCGIGTLSGLLASFLNADKQLTALDVSDESIRIAKERLKKHGGINWVEGSVLNATLNNTFDVIVLPDVLEHIPLQTHNELFQKLATCLKPTGFIAVHIPFPHYLDWCRKHTPETLQVIDQSLHLHLLTESIYANGFSIVHMETYSIWMKPVDYQFLLLKPNGQFQTFEKDTSLAKKIKNRGGL